ncbi:MAG TPA: hypothetical protein VGQ83_43260 [Polyangia bacterium]
MADNSTKQFRRYRQVVGVSYLAFVGLAVVYLIVSISVALLHRHRTRPTRPPIGNQPRPEEIVACYGEVERLFADLNARYFELPGQLAKQPIDLRTRVLKVQKDWQRRWREVGQVCRFSDLAGTGLGPGFDQLALIHSDLEELDIGYAALLSRFKRQLAPGVDDIRRKLEASRLSLEVKQRQAGAPPAHHNQ